MLLDTLHGGDYFGELTALGGRDYAETVIAQTDCCTLQISSADFESILSKHPEVARRTMEVVSQCLAESREIV